MHGLHRCNINAGVYARVRVGGGGRWKSSNRKNVYLSPYVEEPLNSKVIKSSVPELRSRKCFSCFEIPRSYVYMYLNIICPFRISVSWVWYIHTQISNKRIRSHTHTYSYTHIYLYVYIYTKEKLKYSWKPCFIYIYIYIYKYIYVRVCVCVCASACQYVKYQTGSNQRDVSCIEKKTRLQLRIIFPFAHLTSVRRLCRIIYLIHILTEMFSNIYSLCLTLISTHIQTKTL